MKLGVVILAAGMGKRMRSDLPKVLHPLAGRPMLAHVVAAATRIGAARTVVVYGHGGAEVRAALADEDCAWVEQAQQLGTGHAVLQAMPLVQDMDRVLVLYGDVPLVDSDTLSRLIEASRDSGLGILTVLMDDPTGYGRIIRDAGGRILRSVEQKDGTPEELAVREANTGFLVADRARLDGWLQGLTNANAQGEYYLTDVIGLAVAQGERVASVHPVTLEEVSGVNDRVQLAALERFHQRRLAEGLMRNGVTLADPARIDIRGRLTTGRDLFIDVNLICEGEVTLGDGVRIGPNCLIRDSIIGDGTHIFANCVIEGAQVGTGARIGPFARLRPEARLAPDTHIGNFVEIKKANVGEGSKVNHLTYIGDTDIGAGVNVGAGTITCNYDGANKFRTLIGDGAFIGSNASLVAPVTIGAGATIGAGSVINRDAPPGELTVTRARQTTIPGWQRPRKQPKT
ncbi:bifunctional UDP-N-acetylglucosamine diphosphorylase/glucosamine-1-phosphate N-acetyltransferase GlmU [Candidatus Thiodictyon syntrophicum]|jgi:bifunctional UDP-N-acetylglucosamine pyrophosphorylase/glucosamine-1-phosphate N-acetyltransferase|uniref:Bifunctional protein GlmU n=1 Tax=Candidatus Thiodictyon syntrophicum TaxID=1166950 RepID=A0A2K8UG59_9GAMM|nr:bifunctional UDP-N-acetylglucosamine diphosphorylase/glucosamine-1-phosphate N-acetyltransferase GlmU [Candidatus Thiodictyon syntrophicum]AUB84554.1 UDP-N-acetylglucosamine diphosphorylase/glucosamine-1-phosphate N-acetyltransferase [Candidatus Thiodictyon syntrophicum]